MHTALMSSNENDVTVGRPSKTYDQKHYNDENSKQLSMVV